MKKISFFAAVAVLGLSSAAFAQTDYFARGVNGSFAAPPEREFVLTSGTYSVTFSVTAGADATTKDRWKGATSGWGNEVPGGGDYGYMHYLPVATGNQTFTIQTNRANDGFSPDAAGTGLAGAYGYSTLTASTIATADCRIVGSFQSELGGTDWDYATAPTISAADLSGGLWVKQLTGIPVGSYQFRIYLEANPTWPTRLNIGTDGLTNGDNNFSFTIFSAGENITVSLNPNNGRTRVQSSNPLSGQAGPPFFAVSNAAEIGGSPSAANQLGANTSANGLWYARKFTIATAGEYSVKATDYSGAFWPSGGNFTADPPEGGTPFVTSSAGQQVVVIFDRGTYTDGYEPASNFVVVLGEEASGQRSTLNTWFRVQPVGPLTALGHTGDFDNNQPFYNLDQIGSTNVWRKAFDSFAAGSYAFKAVLDRTSTTTGWQYQAGPGKGLVSRGPGADNGTWALTGSIGTPVSYTCTVDATTGRVAIQSTAAKAVTEPVRNATYFVAQSGDVTSGVSEWMEF